ncbi:MAG: SdiA-regulated domain-containing protein [Lewinellaceae bacterium]|nr:SdiA-regulated domain-containing protein [Lewinellaceae bacterium]
MSAPLRLCFLPYTSALPAILLLLLHLSGCTGKTPAGEAPATTLPYQLDKPDTVFVMPQQLREISGLSMSSDERHLLAVNDEEGLIYYIDPETGVINSTFHFGETGDYEGVEAAGGDIYAVKSNGVLSRIMPDSGKVETYPTGLKKSNDVEGLAFDVANNRLLLACKGKDGKNPAIKGERVIYAFDLSGKRLSETPVITLHLAEIGRLKKPVSGFSQKLNDFFSTDQKSDAFGPSGLAFCPIDGNLYIIASVGKAIAVLQPDGKIAQVEWLSSDVFRQPEGICFDRRGRMYISSEGGKKGYGKILRFSPQNR